MSLNTSKDILKKSGTVFIIKIAASSIGLVTALMVSNFFTSETAGSFFYAFSLITFCETLSRAGLDNTILKEITPLHSSSLHIQKKEYFNSILIINIFIAILISLATLLIGKTLFDNELLSQQTVFAISLFIPISVLNLTTTFYQSTQRIYSGFIIGKVIPQTIFLLTIPLIYLFHLASPTEPLLYSLLISYSIVILYLIIKSPSSLSALFTKFTPIKKVLGKSKSFAITSLMSLIHNSQGVIILGWFSTASGIAFFTIAYKVASINVLILASVNSIIAPKFSQLNSEDQHIEMKHLAKKTTRLMILFSLPIFLLCELFAEEILNAFGDEYSNASTALRVLAIGQFINAATGAVTYLLQMSGFANILAKIFIINTIFSVTLAIILSSSYGLIGAAISSSISIATLNIAALITVRIKLKFWMI